MQIGSSKIEFLQGPAATANGNGIPVTLDGFDGAVQVEVVEAAGGTCTLKLQGSFDAVNWYAVGYYQVDNNASLSRSVSDVSVTANLKHVYQVLDPYPQMRAAVSAVAGGCSVSVRAYCIPA